jgi:hypothetical protein
MGDDNAMMMCMNPQFEIHAMMMCMNPLFEIQTVLKVSFEA